MVFLEEEGFPDHGRPAPEASCRAYRALYPGEVECFDEAWRPLS